MDTNYSKFFCQATFHLKIQINDAYSIFILPTLSSNHRHGNPDAFASEH